MKKVKKISWKVPSGNPAHEIPEGAVIILENETQIATMSFDAKGDIQIFQIDKKESLKYIDAETAKLEQ